LGEGRQIAELSQFGEILVEEAVLPVGLGRTEPETLQQLLVEQLGKQLRAVHQ
jgi:hypothetical protein